MKDFKFFILLLITSTSPCFSQGWKLSNNISGTQVEPKYSCLDKQNNTYVMTSFLDTVYKPSKIVSTGRRDILLSELSNSGELLWSTLIGSDSVEVCGGIIINSDDELLLTGGFSKTCSFSGSQSLTSSGGLDIFLANYSTGGVLNWVKKIGWGNKLQVTTDIVTDESSILITGYYTGTIYIGSPTNYNTHIGTTSTYYGFLAKFDYNGNLIWSKSYPATSNNTSFRRVCIADDGYYIGGSYQGTLTLDIGTLTSTSSSLDMFLYKTDFDGNGQWVRTFKGTGTESFRSLENDEYNNAYVLGSYSSTTLTVDSTATQQETFGNAGGYDAFIAKYNRNGQLQWFRKRGSTSNDYYYDIAIKRNIIYSAGYFANQMIFNKDTLRTSGTSNKDAFLGVFNQKGDPITGESITGNGNYDDAALSVCVDNSSQAYVVGSFKSPYIKIGDSTYYNIHSKDNKSDLFFAIYQHPLKAVITAERKVSCHGLNNGMLTVTPYFGKAPYTYKWSHNASLNDSVANNLPVGNYSVTITDANSQMASISAEVTQPAVLGITGVATPASCRGYSDGTINITATGGTHSSDYTYAWTTLDGSGVKPLNEDQTGLTSGNYTVVVVDDNSCRDTADFTVTQPEPFIFKESSIVSHPGPTWDIDLHVSGGNVPYTYSWSGPGSYTAPTEDISGLTTGGLYTVAITDDEKCHSDTGFVVNDGTTLIAQVTSKTDVTCYGLNNGTATVTVTNGIGTLSFEWSDNPGVPSSLNVRTGMAPGNYSVQVTDGSSNIATATVTIVGPAAAVAAVLDPQDLSCNGDNSGVVDLTVSGGTAPYDFAWNNSYTGEDLVNVAANTYFVVITDANGCSLQPPSVVVNQPDPMFLDISQSGSNLCYGDKLVSATANASGGMGSFTYLWDDPGAQITKTAFELEAGTYNVVVTDANGCAKSTSTIVTEPDSLSVDATLNVPSCPGTADGTIISLATGGTGPYDYVWSNSVYNRINNNINAGAYTLTVTDHNSCQLIRQYTLTDPDSTRIASVNFTDVSCLGLNDGSITLGASGGNGTYEYSIDNGSTFVTTSTFSPLANGDYNLVARDGNACPSKIHPFTLGVSDTVKIGGVDVTDVTCLGLNNGSIIITATGGDANYTYSIDGGANFVATSLFGLLTGNDYTVLAKDNAGCTSESQTVTIGVDDTVKITHVGFENVTCLGLSDGYIAIEAIGGTGAYEYSTNGGDSYAATDSVTSLPNGDYSIIVRDAQGCFSEIVPLTLINEDTVSIASVDYTDLTCSGLNDGTITVTANGGTGTYMYSSDGGTSFYTGSVIDSLATGSYAVVVRDGNNCRSEEYPVILNKTDVCGLIIYDAFSPNNDGKNDVWNIGNVGSFPEIDVKIFNIWGKMVFSSKGYSKPWDGEYEGKDLPAGTYYYVIDPGDGSKTLTGPVSIVK